jgi:hypothetical protein
MYKQNRTLKRLAIIALILTLSTIFAAAETTVSVNAPVNGSVTSDTFDVKIDIANVEDLDSGKFELFFDPRVVRVTDVMAGSIDGTPIPISNWDYVHDLSTKCVIEVLFDLPGFSGVSGSGHLAMISFEVTGEDGNCSFLNISTESLTESMLNNGELVNKDANEIIAEWGNGMVCIGDPSSFDDSSDSDDSTRDTQKARVTVFVNNRDDDALDIELYIDGMYKKNKRVSKDTKEEYSIYTLDEGTHTFEIRWHDHDTNKDYVQTEDRSVSGTTAVTIRTDEHTEDDNKLSVHVYVKNLDGDDPDVYLFIDEVYRKYKSISSGSVGDYGEYEFETDEDTLHSFRIEWFDPGTNVTYEKIVRSYITGEEAVTLYIDRHTEEDIILLSDSMQTPVSTISNSTPTHTRTVREPTPIPTKTQITEMNTNPVLAQDSSKGDMTQHVSATCTLVAFVAVLFVLMQVKRI